MFSNIVDEVYMFFQQVMAIKKIENAALSLQDEDNFLEAISHMSRLRHPNIVPLTGYCTEHGQRLLVHDYIANGSLQDMLYLSDDRIKVLTWNVRIKLALGIARALEYVKSTIYLEYVKSTMLLWFPLNFLKSGTCMKCACLQWFTET